MVSPMHAPQGMATHAINYDAEITRRILRHEQHIKWSVVAFAAAVLLAAVIWISFLGYL
jgi:hypothetical protein